MDATENPVATAIDGATGDWSISGDAMRWSPELAERCAGAGGLDAAVGVGSGLGAGGGPGRRLVTGALPSLGTAADGVVPEVRQLPCGTSPGEEFRD